MVKLFKFKLIVPMYIGIIVYLVSAPALAVQTQDFASLRYDGGWLLWPKLLEQAKLKRLWKRNLPLMQKEKLERLMVLGDNIYALTERNYLFALDRHTGKALFDKSLAPPGFTVLGLKLYEDELICVVGNKIVELNPDNAAQIGSYEMDFGITCLPGKNESSLYVAGSDKLLHVFRADDKVRLFQISSGDYTMITSVLAFDDVVVFSTAGGRVVCIAADEPVKKWQFAARQGVVGPMIKDGQSLFFASEDTYVYQLPLYAAQKPVWKFQTEAILNKAPQVTKDFVYQYVHGRGLTAVEKRRGRLMWKLSRGLDLLAEAGDKAYIFKKNGWLVVMDNNKARKHYSVNFARVTRYATNVIDSKIYVADEYGRILCLQPEK